MTLKREKLKNLIDFKQKNTYQRLKIFAFFGIITIDSQKVLLMVTKAERVADFRHRPIMRVIEVHGKIIIKNSESTSNGEKMIVIMENIRKYLKKGFYFSYYYDLLSKFPLSIRKNETSAEVLERGYGTVLDVDQMKKLKAESDDFSKFGSEFGMLKFKKQKSFGENFLSQEEEQKEVERNQKNGDLVTGGELDLMFGGDQKKPQNEKKLGNKNQDLNAKNNSKQNSDSTDKNKDLRKMSLNTKYLSRVESIFAWNLNACQDFFESPNFPECCHVFFPPFIQGHVGGINIKKGVDLLLISRRSYIMGGTRYNSRGINPSGFVSNFAESEQIIDLGHRVYSYLQIRGSVPFFWDQKKVGREVSINQTESINQQVFINIIIFLVQFSAI